MQREEHERPGRRQSLRKIGVAADERPLLRGGRSGAGHVADQVNHGVAIVDVRIELIERVAAEILEIILDFHRDVVPREIAIQLFAVSKELVGNGRKEDAYWHGAAAAWSNVAILPRFRRCDIRMRSAVRDTRAMAVASWEVAPSSWAAAAARQAQGRGRGGPKRAHQPQDALGQLAATIASGKQKGVL